MEKDQPINKTKDIEIEQDREKSTNNQKLSSLSLPVKGIKIKGNIHNMEYDQ